MTRNEILTLAEREAQRLTDENDHGAAIIMRALMDQLRSLSAPQAGEPFVSRFKPDRDD